MNKSITVSKGFGDKAWALTGAVGLAGLALGWMLGAGQPAVPATPSEEGTLAEMSGARSGGVPLDGGAQGGQDTIASAGAAAMHATAVSDGDCGRLPVSQHVANLTDADADADADAAERRAVLHSMLGQDVAKAMSDAELARDGPAALLALVHNQQADADARIEAAFAMQAYFDTSLPAPVARQVLDMAANDSDPLVQRDALDLLRGRMQPDLVAAVSAFLRSPDEGTREMAIQRLKELPQDSQARGALAQVAQQDGSEVLRYLAAHHRE